jgi:hypothetical protein
MNLWIFEASARTHPECQARSLFGSNKNWPLQVRRDDICFLYNYSEKQIYGVWFADTDGRKNIEPDAWGGEYPYQAKVRRAGTIVQAVPKTNVWATICKPDTAYVLNKLWGERAHNLVQYFAHLKHEGFVSGIEFDSIETDYRNRFPATWTTSDGHRVRSKAELIIDDHLYKTGRPHAYEPVVFCGTKKLIPDFLLKCRNEEDVCIEYWGMLDDEAYRRRMEWKRQLYASNQIRLIDVTDEDLKSPDLFLEEKLRKQGC